MTQEACVLGVVVGSQFGFISCRHYVAALHIQVVFSALILLVGHQEEHPTCKRLSDEVLAWLSVWNKVQMICIWSS